MRIPTPFRALVADTVRVSGSYLDLFVRGTKKVERSPSLVYPASGGLIRPLTPMKLWLAINNEHEALGVCEADYHNEAYYRFMKESIYPEHVIELPELGKRLRAFTREGEAMTAPTLVERLRQYCEGDQAGDLVEEAAAALERAERELTKARPVIDPE